MGSLDRRILELERVARPREWDHRVQLAARLYRQLDDLPLERAARLIAAAEEAERDGGDPDDPRLMEKHLGLDVADVQAVIGPRGDGMALWRDALRGLLARAHSSAHRPAFLAALRRERESRGLPTDETEED